MGFTTIQLKNNISLLDGYSSRAKIVPIICGYCNKIKYYSKHYIQSKIDKRNNFFCNSICSSKYNTKTNTKEVICNQCNKIFVKSNCEITKTNHNFCSLSCAGKYSNSHKKQGTRSSKLEKHLAEYIAKTFPNIEVFYNTIQNGFELDIYIPNIKTAFEINGIFHYKPIYGQEKLQKIIIKDKIKTEWCSINNIELVIIKDELKKFKPDKAKPYEEIVYNKIMARLEGF